VLAEYLRVDEIARRFDVSTDDVLGACYVLGFHATDNASLIELDLFTHAVKDLAERQHAREVARARATSQRRRFASLAVVGSAATFVLMVSLSGGFGGGSPGRATTPRTAQSIAATSYKTVLQSTYEQAVGDAPTATDYRVLVEELRAIQPPAALALEHAQLVDEAEDVAALVEAIGSPAAETTAAAIDALRAHIGAPEQP
jgi:hypothetical protein